MPLQESEKVHQLRPVSFHYKTEASGPLQYGLIAEEVAQVYPELVTRDESGVIEGVRYEALTPLLLKELQGQHQQIATQAQQLDCASPAVDDASPAASGASPADAGSLATGGGASPSN